MKILIAVCLMIIWIPVSGMGAEFNIPNRFKSGNEIKAQEFNENYEAIEAQINMLRKELDSIKSKIGSLPSPSIVHTKSWSLKKTEQGTATEWSNLPTEMALPIKTDKSALFITADISRFQHNTPNVNTEYRIIIETTTLQKNEIARTNTGNHASWAFGPLVLHAVGEVEPGNYIVRVQYKTQRGIEYWHNDRNGYQFRRLTVLEVPIIK